jgi:hypothetical protein
VFRRCSELGPCKTSKSFFIGLTKAKSAHLVGLAAAAGIGVWVLLKQLNEGACFSLMNESMKPSAEASKSV